MSNRDEIFTKADLDTKPSRQATYRRRILAELEQLKIDQEAYSELIRAADTEGRKQGLHGDELKAFIIETLGDEAHDDDRDWLAEFKQKLELTNRKAS